MIMMMVVVTIVMTVMMMMMMTMVLITIATVVVMMEIMTVVVVVTMLMISRWSRCCNVCLSVLLCVSACHCIHSLLVVEDRTYTAIVPLTHLLFMCRADAVIEKLKEEIASKDERMASLDSAMEQLREQIAQLQHEKEQRSVAG